MAIVVAQDSTGSPASSLKTRANVLAERLEQGARALETAVEPLTDREWQVRIPKDGRTVGVVVHHVATMYPLEIELSQQLAAGRPITDVTWDDVHGLNARHATENVAVTKDAALELLRRNSTTAAAAIRALTDDELDRAAGVSLNADAPLTCQFFLEDHAVRHSYHHLAKIRAALASVQGSARATTIVTCDTAMPADRARAIKAKQQAMWASGDFAVIGTTLQIVGELLNEATDVRAVHNVLDVAAGNGNATLAAARRFANVTSTDYVAALLDGGRRRADAEGFANVTFEVADAEALPYRDASFDVVLSTFGVMFAPDHRRAASELARVCKPAGRIGLASWTPSGFLGRLLRLVAEFVAPAPGVQSPLLWGTADHVRELFPDAVKIENTARTFAFRYRSPEHWVEIFRNFYGPTHTAFMSLDAAGQTALDAALLTLLRSQDVGGGDGLVVPAEYLETVITM